MKKPSVSIIIPCYNLAEYLTETLESVLIQTYENWECIIMNDGSTDNTDEIVQKWCIKDKRYKYIKQSNQGVIAARNISIKSSIGKYILPLDADDKIDAYFLEEAVKFLENNESDIIFGIVETFGTHTERWDKEIFSIAEELKHNLIPITALYRREIWESIGGYNSKMKNGFEDWDFWLSAIEKGFRVKQLFISMLYYRQTINSRSLQISSLNMFNLRKELSINHMELYLEHLGDPLNLYYKIKEVERQKQLLENSFTYKFGKILLNPFKTIYNLFK